MTSQALERARPQEQALVRTAKDLNILHLEGGALMIDLSGSELGESYNVSAPAATLVQADANFTPSIGLVTFNPDTEAGDFYTIEKPKAASGGYAAKPGMYALAKKALDTLGKMAGIEDLGPDITDFGSNAQNLRVTWHSQVRRPDGTMQHLVGTREWIEEDEAALLRASVPDWVIKPLRDGGTPLPADDTNSKYRKWWAENWYGRVKKHRQGMTETKARLRAYRQALTLKSKYTLEDIRKPFLVVSTTFTPDTSDIRILGMLMGLGAQAETALFGPASEQVALPAGDEPIEGHVTEEEELPSFDRATGEVQEPQRLKPANDPILPDGPHKGKPLSEVARVDPGYTRETLLRSTSPKWGLGATDWLAYWEGAEDASTSF